MEDGVPVFRDIMKGDVHPKILNVYARFLWALRRIFSKVLAKRVMDCLVVWSKLKLDGAIRLVSQGNGFRAISIIYGET